MDRLAPYRAKRRASGTPEPFGGEAGAGGSLFVVHHHHARNLHWDLRLELDGALVCWAVPKGPSADPADKRLAMHVEDHPLEYAEFEGVIPEGQYGAGPTIVWDKGVWIPVGDPREGIASGKLLFQLRGYKLQGLWTLVHTPRAGERHWLLIKERDAYVDERGTEAFAADSVYSGLAVDDLPRRAAKEAALAARAAEAGAPEAGVETVPAEPMLATAADEPFSRPGWVFEIKYDGYRLLAVKNGERVTLASRNGNDLTATFPEVARAVAGLPFDELLVDGEVVVHDERGLPRFGLLQKRGRLQKAPEIRRATLELPATYYAFDLLAVGGRDTRALPLVARKELLKSALPTVGPIRFSDHVDEHGEAVYRRVTALGLEGIVAKKADAPYRAGRSTEWLKIRTIKTHDFVVVGWSERKGPRGASGPVFGALHLAWWSGGRLTWCGSVGTGFPDSLQAELAPVLARLEEGQAGPPCTGDTPKGRDQHWIRPELVAEVRYKELTEAGRVRHPSFVRLRDDKQARECDAPDDEGATLPEPAPVEPAPPEKVIHFTNLEKVLWPDAGVTKGELVDYYRTVGPWLLPYLEDRCLVVTRYPDGIDGNSFYQKNAPDWAPDWIRTATVWSEGSERELAYFVVDDLATLLYVANSAAIVLHVWSSRVATLALPDWSILDLDPKGAPFLHVVRVALALKEICDEIGLPSFVKTSGSSGLHVLLPLGRKTTYEQSQMLAGLLAQVVVARLPEIATTTRTVSQREGKVYLDALQNGHGKLLVAPYSVRAVPEASVSAPLAWDEVTEELGPRDFTVRNLPERLATMSADPLLGVLAAEPDLLGALGRLAERLR